MKRILQNQKPKNIYKQLNSFAFNTNVFFYRIIYKIVKIKWITYLLLLHLLINVLNAYIAIFHNILYVDIFYIFVVFLTIKYFLVHRNKYLKENSKVYSSKKILVNKKFEPKYSWWISYAWMYYFIVLGSSILFNDSYLKTFSSFFNMIINLLIMHAMLIFAVDTNFGTGHKAHTFIRHRLKRTPKDAGVILFPVPKQSNKN